MSPTQGFATFVLVQVLMGHCFAGEIGYFYTLSHMDYPFFQVDYNAAVIFESNLATSGFIHSAPSSNITIVTAGIYAVHWDAVCGSHMEWALVVNGVDVPGGVFTDCTGRAAFNVTENGSALSVENRMDYTQYLYADVPAATAVALVVVGQ